MLSGKNEGRSVSEVSTWSVTQPTLSADCDPGLASASPLCVFKWSIEKSVTALASYGCRDGSGREGEGQILEVVGSHN